MPWLIPDAHTQAVEAAREIVLRRLDRSAAPRAALAELLERKEVDPRVASEVLDRLEPPESLTTPPTRPAWRAPASRRRGGQESHR